MWLRRAVMGRRVVREAITKLVQKTCPDPKVAWAAIHTRRKELERERSESDLRALDFAVDRLEQKLAERKVTCDAEAVAPTRVLTGTEFDELVKKEEARAERAQAVVSKAADARAELLVKEGFAGLAPRIVEQQTRTVEPAPVIEDDQQEEMATADDLAALREVR